MTEARRFSSIEHIRAAADRAGSHWFSPGAMRFFGTRVHSTLYGGRYFVTSEQPWDGPRGYAVRCVTVSGDGQAATGGFSIDTVGELCQYATRDAAHQAAREAARSDA